MSWLYSIDVALFRLINGTLANSFFDSVMPVFAGNAWFWPVLIICGLAALWRGGARGRICVLMLVIVLPVGDGWISNSIKHAVGRQRPCLVLENVNLPIKKSRLVNDSNEYRRAGCSTSGSFPSGHTTNWFAATMVAYLYYRRTLRFMLPLACLVGFSRIYNGVHYPSDVLGGAIIGAGYGIAIVVAVDALWRFIGTREFPLWWARLPSLLLRDDLMRSRPATANAESGIDSHWLRLAYLVIAITCVGRLIYLASGVIELSEDEAYQWLWSKHPALSYYSKPPLIAYVQWLGTHIWGDTEFGVRFFAPVLAAIASIVMLNFFARHVNARAGFWLIVVVSVTPLLALGSTLMTVDPLLVFFWTLAMITGWKAVGGAFERQRTNVGSGLRAQQVLDHRGSTILWAWTGLWMGLAFLSKYTALFQWLCWGLFFALWKPARSQLRRPGPYLALLINVLCAIPVVVWNAQHGWVTAGHVATDAKLDEAWRFQPQSFFAFVGGTAGLMNPIYFVGALWAAIAMWRRNTPLFRYFFAMGMPVLIVYTLYTIHSSVLVNWIAASVVPLLCLMVAWWDGRERAGGEPARRIRAFAVIAVLLGGVFVAFMYESAPFLRIANDVRAEFSRPPLREKVNPHRRVRGWKEMARLVEREQRNLEVEGKPVFIVGGHYGTTSLLSFYMADARTNVTTRPLVYCRFLPRPKTQFYFWPTYMNTRLGENALYVQEKDEPAAPPPDITRSFESVEEVGFFPIAVRGRVLHHVQVFACRGLRRVPSTPR